MQEKFKKFRPPPEYPVYPPYHTGAYLEDYFCNWFYENKVDVERQYIPVSWTTCYIDKKTEGLQELLDKLDPNDKYFTVCQYDDGILNRLPPDTLQFNAGGNSGGIPIPLICSQMPPVETKDVEKTILASFVGSATHPVRDEMYQTLRDMRDYVFRVKSWTPEVVEEDLESFTSIASRSKFLLCPRGYGLNSFRLYEAFQLGCVPVIITDKFFLPWQDELYWPDFSVLITRNNIENIHFVLDNVTESDYNNMLSNGQKLYKEYFTLEGVCQQIIKRLQ